MAIKLLLLFISNVSKFNFFSLHGKQTLKQKSSLFQLFDDFFIFSNEIICFV